MIVTTTTNDDADADDDYDDDEDVTTTTDLNDRSPRMTAHDDDNEWPRQRQLTTTIGSHNHSPLRTSISWNVPPDGLITHPEGGPVLSPDAGFPAAPNDRARSSHSLNELGHSIGVGAQVRSGSPRQDAIRSNGIHLDDSTKIVSNSRPIIGPLLVNSPVGETQTVWRNTNVNDKMKKRGSPTPIGIGQQYNIGNYPTPQYKHSPWTYRDYYVPIDTK